MNKIKFRKKWVILTVINTFMLLIYGMITVISDFRIKSVPDQSAVKYWSPDSNQYSQTSCFISESYNFNIDSVYNMRSAVDTALQEASITTEKENGARLWIDAYSGEKKVTISSESSSPFEVKATFCGGDFFYFHMLDYKSGYCFSETDINNDRIVIDENTAWKLYGSSDIEGMEVQINGRTFIIAGVSECRDDKISEITYGSVNRIYIPYSAYKNLFGEDDIPITCYEILIPSPVSKFGYNIISEYFSDSKDKMAVIENSSRFSVISLLGVVKTYSQRSVITNEIAYPYWENYARVMEDKSALMLIMRIPFLIIPVIYFIVAFVTFWKKYGLHFRHIKDFIEKAVDNRRKKVYYKKVNEKEIS